MKSAVVGFLAGCFVIAGPRAAAPESRASRGDAKAYRLLGATKRLPRLDRGDADRLLGFPRPLHARQLDDPLLAEPEVRRPIADATCDADLVVVARVASATAFLHPNGRWILTSHDLEVTHVARAKDRTLRDVTRVRYVHPSGRDTIAGRTVTTTVERYPALVEGDDLLFFLVRIDKSPTYRASLESPPLLVRGGLLSELAPRPAAQGPSIDGTSAREALRMVNDAVCRPAPGARAPAPLIHTTPFGGPGGPP